MPLCLTGVPVCSPDGRAAATVLALSRDFQSLDAAGAAQAFLQLAQQMQLVRGHNFASFTIYLNQAFEWGRTSPELFEKHIVPIFIRMNTTESDGLCRYWSQMLCDEINEADKEAIQKKKDDALKAVEAVLGCHHLLPQCQKNLFLSAFHHQSLQVEVLLAALRLANWSCHDEIDRQAMQNTEGCLAYLRKLYDDAGTLPRKVLLSIVLSFPESRAMVFDLVAGHPERFMFYRDIFKYSKNKNLLEDCFKRWFLDYRRSPSKELAFSNMMLLEAVSNRRASDWGVLAELVRLNSHDLQGANAVPEARKKRVWLSNLLLRLHLSPEYVKHLDAPLKTLRHMSSDVVRRHVQLRVLADDNADRAVLGRENCKAERAMLEQVDVGHEKAAFMYTASQKHASWIEAGYAQLAYARAQHHKIAAEIARVSQAMTYHALKEMQETNQRYGQHIAALTDALEAAPMNLKILKRTIRVINDYQIVGRNLLLGVRIMAEEYHDLFLEKKRPLERMCQHYREELYTLGVEPPFMPTGKNLVGHGQVDMADAFRAACTPSTKECQVIRAGRPVL